MSTKPKTTLCEKCQQPFRGEKVPASGSRFEHHSTWQGLREAARGGCYICSFYIRNGEQRLMSREGQSDGKSSLKLCVVRVHETLGYLALQLGDLRMLFHAYQCNDRIARAMGDWDPPVQYSRQRLNSLLTPWLRKCKVQHDSCASHARPYIPTRLLLLEPDSSRPFVRLIATADLQSTSNLVYCTVSHRWGHAELPKLESTTIARLKSGIATTDLPQSYQEAIAIAESMNISYVWIDSLCIEQDSILDWRREAGAMYNIYRGAELNIALSGASRDLQTSLSNRDTSLIRAASVRVSWDYVNSGEMDNPVQLNWIIVRDNLGWEDVKDNPLMRRAWVLQEIHLATRILFLGAEQIHYHCRCMSFCETFPGDLPVNVERRLVPRLVPRAGPTHWRNLVKTYSACKLTNRNDRTMAIAGIARWYAEQLNEEYVAGFWRSQLPACLLWNVDQYGSTKRASQYRAPTWSWLSIDGRVTAYNDFPAVTLCDCISVHIDLVDAQNPYGQIANGEIVLHGHLAPFRLWGEGANAMMATTDRKIGKVVALAARLSRDVHRPGLGMDFNDVPLKSDGSVDSSFKVGVTVGWGGAHRHDEVTISRYVRVYALPVYRRLNDHLAVRSNSFGLLLQESKDRVGSFTRIGNYQTNTKDQEHLFNASERRHVRII
ncbi:hypothetical protein CKM354_000433300 [Cercospora kikuchii]|uniref:Heterokaryon incompatibility domain-containing protein n=1 Tax=Cercospora kikuchii TaxID=84275 RepID=A0A9P3CFQ4_9PEZI|nr:uncharacterized protein CKM354_000433300 [Cercospora kikuchii]GIZ41016.1 hypothetical protein CKM354_000433300 [Cercospora kikuchii]